MDTQLELAKGKLQRTVLDVCLNVPFYGAIVMSLPGGVILDDTCTTAYTDGRVIGFSPELVLRMTPTGMKFVMVHEVCHIMLKHHLRKGLRNHDRYNRAADYVIHDNMQADGYKILDWVLYDVKFAGMTTEMVYNLLDDDPSKDKMQGSGGSGTTNGQPVPGDSFPGGIGEVREMKKEDGTPMDDVEKAAEATKVDVQIAQAFQGARAAGKTSAIP
jgi:hypothetical protein